LALWVFLLAFTVQGKCRVKYAMKKILSLTILFALMVLPLCADTAHAQEAIDQQFFEAAMGLDPEARSEFLELIRDPGQFEEAFDQLDIDPGLADRIEKNLHQTNQRHKTDYALEQLDKVTDVIGTHLEKLASQHTGKSREALENALMKRTAGLAIAIEAVSGAKSGANIPDSVELPAAAQAADPGVNGAGNGIIGGGGGGGAGEVGGGAGGVGGGAGGVGGGAGGVGGGAGGAGGVGGGAGGIGGGAGGADNGAGNGADNGKGKK
jgi:hypothetical protein